MTMDPATPGAPARLLVPDDPEPVGEINADSTSPFFLICDHAGNSVPAALHGLGLPQTELDRHIGIDIGVSACAGPGRNGSRATSWARCATRTAASS